MKGHMEKDGFHPHTPYQKTSRKKRSPSQIDGIKIINKTDGNEIINGIRKSLKNQPKSVKNKIKTITIKDIEPDENFIAKADPQNGDVIFNKKFGKTEQDYEALGEHEFEHIDFNNHIQKGDEKYEKFVKDASRIRPFTPDLMMTLQEREDAFIDGNFGILPDKRLEYPDEINSVVKEIEMREKLGLPTNILDEEEFEKAKMLVDNLHKK